MVVVVAVEEVKEVEGSKRVCTSRTSRCKERAQL